MGNYHLLTPGDQNQNFLINVSEIRLTKFKVPQLGVKFTALHISKRKIAFTLISPFGQGCINSSFLATVCYSGYCGSFMRPSLLAVRKKPLHSKFLRSSRKSNWRNQYSSYLSLLLSAGHDKKLLKCHCNNQNYW